MLVRAPPRLAIIITAETILAIFQTGRLSISRLPFQTRTANFSTASVA